MRVSPAGLVGGMLAVAVLGAPAAAASFRDQWKAGAPGCFARAYDDQHLAAHPRQRVTRFALGPSRMIAPGETGRFEITFSLMLKGDSEVYEWQGICRAAAKAVHCGAEGDAGSFTIRPEGSNILVGIDSLVLEGEKGFTPDLGVGGDDRVLRLYPGPDSTCRFGS